MNKISTCLLIQVIISTYDAGHIDEDGYVWIMSRTDDIINVAGHRLSTGAIEEVLAEHKDVAECASLGIADKLKGQIPIGTSSFKSWCIKRQKRNYFRVCKNGKRQSWSHTRF